MEIVVSSIIIIICTIRVVSFGIYTLKNKNIAGAVGLFALAAVVVATIIPTFMN